MDKQTPIVNIVGGGLAGCEAAWQLVNQGIAVRLYEMRPKNRSNAHVTDDLCELVCSNSFKSTELDSPSGCLKWEMQQWDSLIVAAAYDAQVPAGKALAVDRVVFSQNVSRKLRGHPLFKEIREEVIDLPPEDVLQEKNEVYVLATGPLTSEKLTSSLGQYLELDKGFYFYDSIAPIVDVTDIDMTRAFFGNRWDASSHDYLNVPLSQDEYHQLVSEILGAEKVLPHAFEDPKYFEACLPIEVMAERGVETLRFGPLKPVGLFPPSGIKPYAVIQLRRENTDGTMYSMVGFQTRMKWPEQKRVFSQIKALEKMEYLRFGSIHRNTYVNSPQVLNANLSLKKNNRVFLAGQITGVEGYLESAAMGLLVGKQIGMQLTQKSFTPPSPFTMLGALLHYVTHGIKGDFSPMNVNFGILPALTTEKKIPKKEKRVKICQRARDVFNQEMGHH